jgi:hypothetical protein
MLKKYFKTLTMIFIITLGTVLGAGLLAGIVVAPTIFHSELLLGSELLSKYQEGLLMTSIFEKLVYAVNFLVIISILYEVIKYKAFESDRWSLLTTFLVAGTGLMFTSYYIPDILEMQAMGEAKTLSSAFVNTHLGSEINFKIFAFSSLVLLILNLKKALR